MQQMKKLWAEEMLMHCSTDSIWLWVITFYTIFENFYSGYTRIDEKKKITAALASVIASWKSHFRGPANTNPATMVHVTWIDISGEDC